MLAERDLDGTLELATVPVARFDSVGKPWSMAGVECGAGFCGASASGRDVDFFVAFGLDMMTLQLPLGVFRMRDFRTCLFAHRANT